MAQRITDWLQSRSSIFALLFFLSGNVMHIAHRLDVNYIAFMATLLGAVIGQHAVTQGRADIEKKVADLADRHLPYVHDALEEIHNKLIQGAQPQPQAQ